jgi:hypothetical protein
MFNLWDATLRKLHAVRQGLMRGLGNGQLRQAVWERQYWKGADVEGDQKLDFDNVERLCKRLNVNSPTQELRRLFEVRPVFINRNSQHAELQLSRKQILNTASTLISLTSSGSSNY